MAPVRKYEGSALAILWISIGISDAQTPQGLQVGMRCMPGGVATYLPKGADVLMVWHIRHGEGGGPRGAAVGDALHLDEVRLSQRHQLGIVGQLPPCSNPSPESACTQRVSVYQNAHEAMQYRSSSTKRLQRGQAHSLLYW